MFLPHLFEEDDVPLYKVHPLGGGLKKVPLEGEEVVFQIALVLEVAIDSFVMAHNDVFDAVACHGSFRPTDVAFIS